MHSPNMTDKAKDIGKRLFEPGWSGRFGATVLTIFVTALVIAISLNVA